VELEAWKADSRLPSPHTPRLVRPCSMNDLPDPHPDPTKQLPLSREETPPDAPSAPVSSEQVNATGGSAKPKAAFLLPEESFESVYGSEEKSALSDLMTFVEPPPGTPPGSVSAPDVSKVEALFTGWFSPTLNGQLLDQFPSLRIVFHAGGSVKSMVTDEFWDRGVRLTCTARANAVPVAEYTIAQIVLCLKHVWASARATRKARHFVRNDAAVPSCYGSVVGIISVGLIGRMVAERLGAFDVRVICYDPYLSASEAQKLGMESCTLDEVFARSDIVTCHTPLLTETTHLLREKHFASMKPGAAFINTARGSIVHEPEMIAVLSQRPDLLAVLDVTDPEPPAEGSPLFTLPNVLLTPHIAGSIGPECHRMGRMIVDEVRRYRAGEPLIGEVLREQLPLLA
jgi:phosphoglycerate dehydrogenase-like enzyme